MTTDYKKIISFDLPPGYQHLIGLRIDASRLSVYVDKVYGQKRYEGFYSPITNLHPEDVMWLDVHGVDIRYCGYLTGAELEDA